MSGPFGETLRRYAGQDPEDYLKETGMRDDGKWATDAEILAFSKLVDIDIAVWCSQGTAMDHARYGKVFLSWMRWLLAS